MNFKGLMAMTAAVALAATPAIAAGSTSALTPAAETVDGSQQADTGTWVVVGLGLVAAGLGIWALADGGKKGVNAPVSP